MAAAPASLWWVHEQVYILTNLVVHMKPIQVADDILPVSAFKARASELVRSMGTRGRPLIITQNGKPAAVLLSPAEYDRLAYEGRSREAVREGLADADDGRTVSDEELGKELGRVLKRPRKP